MNRSIAVALCMLTTALLAGCDNAPGRRAIDEANVAPDKIVDFSVLYRTNCAGCHGPDGRGGAALALANPIYLAIADADVLRRVTADGIAGTSMPAFARRSGGILTDQQIDAVVNGIRARWTTPSAVAAIDLPLPPYSDPLPGDVRRGRAVFGMYCASCHGDEGRGAPGGSSIVDKSYLALVSDQGLRTTVIAGRPDLGSPDWRGNTRGNSMTSQNISDVVAWLSSQRPPWQGQPH
jgi:cytochrome c oxidase cbb3-type subunit 3